MNLKPTYHFRPEKNWMNDPNGTVYYKGEYHIFYQHNPYGDQWGNIHWGHAKSKDLIQWEHLPLAIYPSNDLGELHCFSGCSVIDDEGIPTIFYTSVGEGARHQVVGAEQWLARSKDDMTSWEKESINPIMKHDMHKDMYVKEWRDPFVWKENEEWFMVLGGSIDNVGVILIYKSKDLLKWEFLNTLYESNESTYIECPNIIKIKDKYVLIISPNGPVTYLVGTIDDNYKFQIEKEGKVDYSGWEGFYATNILEDSKKRKIMWGWLTENARGEFKGIEGWAGAQSIPRVLSLNSDNELIQKPVEEHQQLRKNEISFKNLAIEGEFNTKVKGRSLEILAEIEIENPQLEFIFSLFASENREEETLVRLKPAFGEFTIDRSKSSLAEETHKTELVGKADFKHSNTVKLNIFIDYSTVEVFVNDKEVLSTRVYPIKEDSENVYLLSRAGEINLKDLRIWELRI